MSSELEALMSGLLRNGIQVLRNPNIQRQFAAILQTGGSELSYEEIDWETVITQWDMPFPK